MRATVSLICLSGRGYEAYSWQYAYSRYGMWPSREQFTSHDPVSAREGWRDVHILVARTFGRTLPGLDDVAGLQIDRTPAAHNVNVNFIRVKLHAALGRHIANMNLAASHVILRIRAEGRDQPGRFMRPAFS